MIERDLELSSLLCSISNSLYSSSERFLLANTRVLSPILAYSVDFSITSSTISFDLRKPAIFSSAPFKRNLVLLNLREHNVCQILKEITCASWEMRGFYFQYFIYRIIIFRLLNFGSALVADNDAHSFFGTFKRENFQNVVLDFIFCG